MMPEQRKAPGMRERAPGVWELIVEAGRDPVTGRKRQISRTFRGGLREAKKARAALLTEVGKGRHTFSITATDNGSGSREPDPAVFVWRVKRKKN